LRTELRKNRHEVNQLIHESRDYMTGDERFDFWKSLNADVLEKVQTNFKSVLSQKQLLALEGEVYNFLIQPGPNGLRESEGALSELFSIGFSAEERSQIKAAVDSSRKNFVKQVLQLRKEQREVLLSELPNSVRKKVEQEGDSDRKLTFATLSQELHFDLKQIELPESDQNEFLKLAKKNDKVLFEKIGQLAVQQWSSIESELAPNIRSKFRTRFSLVSAAKKER